MRIFLILASLYLIAQVFRVADLGAGFWFPALVALIGYVLWVVASDG